MFPILFIFVFPCSLHESCMQKLFLLKPRLLEPKQTAESPPSLLPNNPFRVNFKPHFYATHHLKVDFKGERKKNGCSVPTFCHRPAINYSYSLLAITNLMVCFFLNECLLSIRRRLKNERTSLFKSWNSCFLSNKKWQRIAFLKQQ